MISSSVLYPLRCRPRPGKKRRGAANATGCPTVAEQWENWRYKAASNRCHSSSCCCGKGLFWSHEVGARSQGWCTELRLVFLRNTSSFIVERNLFHTEIFRLLFLKRLCRFMCPTIVVHLEIHRDQKIPFHTSRPSKWWKLFRVWDIN